MATNVAMTGPHTKQVGQEARAQHRVDRPPRQLGRILEPEAQRGQMKTHAARICAFRLSPTP